MNKGKQRTFSFHSWYFSKIETLKTQKYMKNRRDDDYSYTFSVIVVLEERRTYSRKRFESCFVNAYWYFVSVLYVHFFIMYIVISDDRKYGVYLCMWGTNYLVSLILYLWWSSFQTVVGRTKLENSEILLCWWASIRSAPPVLISRN